MSGYNTKQRRALLAFLGEHPDELLTARQMADELAEKQISLSAVYRNLAQLEVEEKVRRSAKSGSHEAFYQYDRTQDAVVLYDAERESIIRALAVFSFAEAEAMELVPEHTSRALNRKFEDKLAVTVMRQPYARWSRLPIWFWKGAWHDRAYTRFLSIRKLRQRRAGHFPFGKKRRMRRADGAFRLRQDHRDKACQRACAVLLSRSFQRKREDRRQGHIRPVRLGDTGEDGRRHRGIEAVPFERQDS